MILFLMILFPSDFPESTGRDSQNHEEQNHGETVNGGPATITKCVAHSTLEEPDAVWLTHDPPLPDETPRGPA